MKTWEMIEMLSENPKLEAVDNDGYTVFVDNDGIFTMVDGNNDEDELILFLDEEWEITQQPVSFMEAFEAWLGEKKSIKWANKSEKKIFLKKTELLTDFQITAYEIVRGKWYILD